MAYDETFGQKTVHAIGTGFISFREPKIYETIIRWMEDKDSGCGEEDIRRAKRIQGK